MYNTYIYKVQISKYIMANNKTEMVSNCCGATEGYYTDPDRCPKCGEPCEFVEIKDE